MMRGAIIMEAVKKKTLSAEAKANTDSAHKDLPRSFYHTKAELNSCFIIRSKYFKIIEINLGKMCTLLNGYLYFHTCRPLPFSRSQTKTKTFYVTSCVQ